MTIYVDVVFMENLFMNYIILFATAIINKEEIKIIRLILASVLGSTYAVISFMPFLQNIIGFFIKIILSIAMIYIAFRAQTIKRCLKQLLIFYLTSFTFGGVAFALLYFVNPSKILTERGIYIGTYPIKMALLGGIVGFIVITVAFKLIKGSITKKDMFCDIEVQIDNKIKKMRAMLDTGNLLKEPITGLPVVIIEKEQLEKLIPYEILINLDNIIEGKTDKISHLEAYISRFRVIPFSSIGSKNGLLLGIKSDLVKIEKGEEYVIKKDVILGIYEEKLCKNRSYHALIGLDMIS